MEIVGKAVLEKPGFSEKPGFLSRRRPRGGT
jgi:hypothetical protein